MKSEEQHARPGQTVMAAPVYSPPLEPNRRRRGKNRRTLVGMMSVGALLNVARQKFATEEGELDIDEDGGFHFTCLIVAECRPFALLQSMAIRQLAMCH